MTKHIPTFWIMLNNATILTCLFYLLIEIEISITMFSSTFEISITMFQSIFYLYQSILHFDIVRDISNFDIVRDISKHLL